MGSAALGISASSDRMTFAAEENGNIVMYYKFTIIFTDILDAEQANKYTEKIGEFLDKELTEDWIAFGQIIKDEAE